MVPRPSGKLEVKADNSMYLMSFHTRKDFPFIGRLLIFPETHAFDDFP